MLRRSADSPWLEQPRGVPGVRRGQASLLRGPRTPTRTSLGPTTPPSLHPGVRRARPPSAAPGARPSTRVRSPGAPLIGQHPHPAKPGPKPRFYVSPNRSREPRAGRLSRCRTCHPAAAAPPSPDQGAGPAHHDPGQHMAVGPASGARPASSPPRPPPGRFVPQACSPPAGLATASDRVTHTNIAERPSCNVGHVSALPSPNQWTGSRAAPARA